MATRTEILEQVRDAHDDLLRLRDRLEGLGRSLRTPAGRLAAAVGHTLRVLAAEFPSVAADAALDRLIEHPAWTHPAQAIFRPRPPLTAIFEAGERRLSSPEPPPPRLLEVRAKLRRAIRIEEEARRRRERRRRQPPGESDR